MVYIIRKKTNYQDLGHQRIDVGLYYVEEKNIDTPKEYVLFGTKCCERFIEEDVFFDDKISAYVECAKRNKEVINSILNSIADSIKSKPKESTTKSSVVTCKDCKYLMFSDCYGEYSKGIKGIVNPDDYCGKGERKEH